MSDMRDLNIPHMGSVENARFVRWLIEEGQSFSRGDILYEIETDKTATEVEADASGVLLRKLAQPDDEFRVGDKIGVIGPKGMSPKSSAELPPPPRSTESLSEGPVKPVFIPHMGSVENARFVCWRVEEGARYSKGDILYEVETDKTTTDVEAESAGILVRRLATEGDEYKVGDAVGLCAKASVTQEEIEAAVRALKMPTNIAGSDATKAASKSRAAPAPTESQSVRAGESSPLARRIAKEAGLDLSGIRGTGPGGRITGDDVRNAASDGIASTKVAGPEIDDPRLTRLPHDRVRHSMRRKTIARRYTETVRRAPHLTADMEIDLTSLMNHREALKRVGEKAPSILGYVAKCAADLMAEHPLVNATFTEDDIILWKTVNLCIAVDTEDGLIVPVIRDAQTLTALEITEEIVRLAGMARSGTLSQTDVEGGTFTISNPGSIGPVVRAEAILNGPQVALLGLAGIVRRAIPIEQNDGSYQVEVRQVLTLSLSHDHRALDGGPVIRYLNALKAAIEHAR